MFTSPDLVPVVFSPASFSFSTKEFSRNNTRRIAGTNANNLFIFLNLK
jgi:hypothetical protein